MSMIALQGAVELGLMYSLVALGIFISYRVLNVADLTVDGCFTLGAAVSAVLTAAGHPMAGMLIAGIAGVGAGIVTAFLQTKLKVQPILAGILTTTGLYTVNLRVMGGKANVSLLNVQTIFPASDALGGVGRLFMAAILVAVLVWLLQLFFQTQMGLSLRATGDNESMVRASSINTDKMKFLGLGLANGIVGLSGALLAQYQSFADIGMGTGMVVIGLASLIIGEVILGRKSILGNMIAAVIGAILYRGIITLVLNSRLSASDLKLISAVIVVVAISYPVVKERYSFHQMRKAGKRHVTALQSKQDLL